MDKTARIRELNDRLRQTFSGGRIMLSAGVDALDDTEKALVLAKVRAFDAFDHDNDPHHEHDFVNVDHGAVTYFAKIDYYDADLRFGSEDPADPSQTIRVLTIMRADEY